MKIIRPSKAVLRLETVMATYPESTVVPYTRMSDPKQAGRGNEKLAAAAATFWSQLRAICSPERLRREPFAGVEQGKLSCPRPELLEATVPYCLREVSRTRKPVILAAPDSSRLIRSEAYDRRTNREAVPTEDEWARLLEMTQRNRGVLLATLLDPDLPEDGPGGRHSIATKRGGPGRPKAISDEDWPAIRADLGVVYETRNGARRWMHSLQEVATRFGVSARTIRRRLREVDPATGRSYEESAVCECLERRKARSG